MKQFHITKFVRRQTSESGFSHWEIPDSVLLERIQRNFDKKKIGYREGVVLVPVEPDGFFSGIVQLQEGDRMVGEYKARREGEDPRKSNYALKGKKISAKSVWIVLYNHSVLIEKNENESDAEWEIVSINASPTDEEPPIPTGALIANHLELSGGTNTKLSNDKFVELLRQSILFWKDKSLAAPDYLRTL